MAEAGLSLGFPDFRADVAEFLGYTRDSDKWTADQKSQLSNLIQAGLRQFYFPPATDRRGLPLIPGTTVGHEWSFLSPTTTLRVAADRWVYDAPDDFGHLVGNMTFEPEEGMAACAEASPQQILEWRQAGSVRASPRRVGVRPKSTTGVDGQRFEFVFWPTPDAEYVMSYRYFVLLGAISEAQPYPYGGLPHAETARRSCLAEAEHWANDARGERYEAFLDALRASIGYDYRCGWKRLGYNADRSDDRRARGVIPIHYVRVNGVLPEE